MTENIARLLMTAGNYYGSAELRTAFGLSSKQASTVLRLLHTTSRYQLVVKKEPLRVKVLAIGPVVREGRQPTQKELSERQQAQIQYLNTQVFKRQGQAAVGGTHAG
ncbi:hypothetical protein B3C1_08031 [Gallaecimonas xiamenensis 3-C-1]|uniref:Uncharacterized protein n=2 Tax=Gallaecimonas TaxID=745410 RepID=K2JY44_9GAMM|nr:hypothetical protein B3C1_08031 [Gallaecimonas xiamenensis 3-C-1]